MTKEKNEKKKKIHQQTEQKAEKERKNKYIEKIIKKYDYYHRLPRQ